MPEVYKNLVAGEWVGAGGGATGPDINPADISDVVALFPAMDAGDVTRHRRRGGGV
ncbi:MAG: hypothetical protein HY660_02855 [Armatimonadetes bacterium]|nr:hypothetical protein [Armatimonadota bacterium]